MGNVRNILESKSREIFSIPPETIFYHALEIMHDKNVSALVVMKRDKLAGIFTERDYARKVILKGRSSKDTQVIEIMTSPVIYVTPQETVDDCMRMMTTNRVRHLPVVEDEKVVGIVSIGDLVNWVVSAQADAISQLHSYITGTYPG